MSRVLRLIAAYLQLLFFIFPLVSAFSNQSEWAPIPSDHFSFVSNPQEGARGLFSIASPQTYRAINQAAKQRIARIWIALATVILLLPIIIPSHVCIFKWHHHFHFFDFYVNHPELGPPAAS